MLGYAVCPMPYALCPMPYALCPFKILKRPSENFSDGLLYKGKYSLVLILLVAKDKTDRKNA